MLYSAKQPPFSNEFPENDGSFDGLSDGLFDGAVTAKIQNTYSYSSVSDPWMDGHSGSM